VIFIAISKQSATAAPRLPLPLHCGSNTYRGTISLAESVCLWIAVAGGRLSKVVPDKRGRPGSPFEKESFRTVLGLEDMVREMATLSLVQVLLRTYVFTEDGRRVSGRGVPG